MKAPRRHTDMNKGRHRLNTGGPLSSILSEAFRVIRYQKYREGVVRAHSGSEGTWLWTCLLDRMTPPLFFIRPHCPLFLSPFPPFHLPSTVFLPQSSSSLSLLAPFSSSKFPPTSLFPRFSSFTSSSPKPLAFSSKGHFSHGTGYWKD